MLDIEYYVDDCAGARFRGWAWLPAAPERVLDIELAAADGSIVAQVAADTFRADLADAGKRGGACGFAIAVPPVCPSGDYTLRARCGARVVALAAPERFEAPWGADDRPKESDLDRFWSRHIGPLIRAIAPVRLCAIGAGDGLALQHLLDHARRTGGHVDIVEPRPSAPLHALLAAHGETGHSLHLASGMAAVPALAVPDVALLDGDPDWRAVSAELAQLRALGGAAAMPVVLVHGGAGPHARRDGYADPAKIDEGGPADGVLAAIEDFVAAHPDVHLWSLPFWGGLAILVPEARLTPALAVTIDGFYAAEALLDTCRALDADLSRARAECRRAEQRATSPG